MPGKNQVNHDISWVVRRLYNDSLVFGDTTFEYRFNNNDPVAIEQQRKILQKLAEDGAISVRPLPTQVENLAVMMGNANRWDAEIYRITLYPRVFNETYKLHAQNAAEVFFRNSTVYQGDAVHSFRRSSDGAELIKQLWQHRQSKKPSGQLNFEGRSLATDILQINLGSKLSQETVSSLIDSVNRAFKNKGISAKIKKGKTVQLVVIEEESSSKKQYSS